MNRRAVTAIAVLLLWAGGVGLLVQRSYFRPNLERLAEAALRITPGAMFYAVMQNGAQVGFASSTIDTGRAKISTDDYLVADLGAAGHMHRATTRTHVVLSRRMRVESFTVSVDTGGMPVETTGAVWGDSLLVLAVARGGAPADTQRVALSGPVLLPSILPLAVALGESPKVGRRYVLPVFDPARLRASDRGIVVKAESLFVINDSSVFDATGGRWRGVLPDTVHAWQVVMDSGGFAGWIDEQGRVVGGTRLGLRLERLPYEVAHENWRIATAARGDDAADASLITETTAIAAHRRATGMMSTLRVRVRGAALDGFDLAAPTQVLHGDTLVITRDAPDALHASYTLPMGGRRLLPRETRPEASIQSAAPAIVILGHRLAGRDTDPAIVAARIARWVHDSVRNAPTIGAPSALDVLRARSGDANEHTRLYVALARSVGIPARAVTGALYVHGRFYYHAWPEIFLAHWVAVDPTFGEFPADAAHLRLSVDGLAPQAAVPRLLESVRLDALAPTPVPHS